jgi:hypothetical protein
MATKDWKKVKGKDTWKNNKINGFVKIQKHKNGWIVYGGRYPLIKPELDVLVRTKSQALKFARAYMRKH